MAILAAIVLFLKKEKKDDLSFATVEKGDIKQEVSLTGRVEPVEDIDLAFEKSGKVSKVNVSVGDKVTAGQVLVTLDNADLTAQLSQTNAAVESAKAGLNQYQAALDTQRAKLAELLKGVKAEEIQLSENNVSSAAQSVIDAELNLKNITSKAEIDLNNLYDKVKDILNDSYTKADDAINKQIDEMFNNDFSENPELTFSTANSQANIDVKNGKITANNKLQSFKNEVNNLSAFSNQELDQSLINGESYLSFIRDFLSRLNDAVNAAIGLPADTIGVYKTNINTARNNINTAITNINSQKQLIAAQKIINQNNIDASQALANGAKNNLTLAQDELRVKKSGATTEQIEAQQAQVKQAEVNIISQQAQIKQAEANVNNILAQIEKTILYSPIDGIVTKQESRIGEIISPQITVVSIISQADFEIKANVPEADIAKINIGDPAEINLDAYGNEAVFYAKIATIDPAENIIDGVATYKTTFQFLKKDERIKSGMTADINILTEEKIGVLAIPSRAIISKSDNGGEKFVKFVDESSGKEIISEVEIKTGLKGSNGRIEILSGLSEGDKIIMP